MRRILMIALWISLGVTLVGCSLQRPAANEWGCQFGKGSFDSRALKKTFYPGEGGVRTNDEFVTIPSDQRYYYIDSDPNTADVGGVPIVVPAKGSSREGVGVVPVSVEVQVRFVFNERACDWYIGNGRRNEPLNFALKTKDDGSLDGRGWNSFLNASMNQKLIEATRPVVADQDWITLYVNGKVDGVLIFERLADELSASLTKELKDDLGEDYFCGPSYKFDGEADGEVADCPPLEVTIKKVTPTNPELVAQLETIVANEEAQRTIASNRERAITQAESDKEQAIAKAEADAEQAIAQSQNDQEKQLAEQQRRQAVETATAEADLAIAQAEAAVLEQQQLNAQQQAAAQAAFCVALAEVGVDCALYLAAQNSVYPNITLGAGGDPTLLVDATP